MLYCIHNLRRKEFSEMFAVSMPSALRNELSLVLPERQYPVLPCLHLTKLEALNPRKPF